MPGPARAGLFIYAADAERTCVAFKPMASHKRRQCRAYIHSGLRSPPMDIAMSVESRCQQPSASRS